MIVSMLLTATAFGQTLDKSRIKTNKIKTVTQSVYQYKYDVQSQTWKLATTGKKVQTATYDQKGNTIEEIIYNANGNIDKKTKYKYDANDHQTEIAIYGSDGIMQEKTAIAYRGDTMSGMTYYDGTGTITGTSFMYYEYAMTPDSNKITNMFIYFGKDSTLAGSVKQIHNKEGKLIDESTYQKNWLQHRETYEYNAKGWLVKKSYYNQQSSFYAAETFKYDEKGNLLEQQMLEDGWLVRSTTIYKSDAKGNYLDAVKKDQKGNPTEQYKYSYTYYP